MSRRSPLYPIALLVVLSAAFGIALQYVNGYYIQLGTYLLVNVLLVSSFRFITIMGRWSFAHVMLAGLGGYTSAILTTRYGFSFWETMFLGGLAAAGAGFVISFPTLRTNGLYYFMSTYAAGALIVWSWTTFYFPFGGVDGLYGVLPPSSLKLPWLSAWDVSSPVGYAELLTVVTFVSLLVLLRLEQTRFGNLLKAMRIQGDLAKSLGVHVRRYEIIAFTVGCFFAGIAGVFFVHSEGIANPTDFGTQQGIDIVLFTVIGGVASFWGPPLGALAMMAVAQWVQNYPAYIAYVPLMYGVITILIVLTCPGGLIAIPARLRALRRTVRPGDGGMVRPEPEPRPLSEGSTSSP